MPLNVAALVTELQQMTVGQLHKKYREVFAEDSRSGNREYLWRRIAWQVQAAEFGGLSDQARLRAKDLADPALLRTSAPRAKSRPATGAVDSSTKTRTGGDNHSRLPSPGTILRRKFRGREIEVLVRKNGFEWEGRQFQTLTAVANAVTGSHWNGFEFFQLRRKGRA